jgi:CRP/FNR family cyclic AMP-dependent transcriptional regulator
MRKPETRSFDMGTMQNAVSSCSSQTRLVGDFFNKLSPQVLKDIGAMAFSSSYPAGMILFSEKDPAPGVCIVLEGEVKLSMNSTDGRLILRIARKGEILGLASALSGKPCEMTAETIHPAKIAPIVRRDFINFLMCHPEVYQTVTEELSRDYAMACEQLRTVGLSNSAPEKLARLLLEWSENGKTTELGTHFRFSLTHGEIGEFIGASRETVTRTLSVFESRHLVMFNGSTLTIPSKAALESYAHS